MHKFTFLSLLILFLLFPLVLLAQSSTPTLIPLPRAMTATPTRIPLYGTPPVSSGVLTPTLIPSQIPNAVYNPLLPGVTCGNAEAKDSASRCCYFDSATIKNTITSLPKFGCLPIAGLGDKCASDLANEAKSHLIDFALNFPIISNIFDLQKKYNVPCATGIPSGDASSNTCLCRKVGEEETINTSFLCQKYLAGTNEYDACVGCAGPGGVWTALGCVYGKDLKTFIEVNVFGLGIGIAGIMAFLCIVYAAFRIQISEGNPEKVKKAQEMVTSCVMGLLLIIFSVFILRLIGVDILQLPGLSK